MLKVNQILNSDFHQVIFTKTRYFPLHRSTPGDSLDFGIGGIFPIPPSTRWKVEGDKKTRPEYFPLTGRRRSTLYLPPGLGTFRLMMETVEH